MSMTSFDDSQFDEWGYRPKQAATIQEALAAIRMAGEHDATLPAAVVHCLSDLSGDDLAIFKETWPSLPVEKRRWAMRTLTEISETDFTVQFDSVAAVGLSDDDAEVRAEALGLTWYDLSEDCFHRVMALAEDRNPLVRTASMQALSRFIEAGELEEFNPELGEKAQELAIRRYRDENEPLEVRRRSLEALSHCSHAAVNDMIHEAYYAEEPLLKVSAVFAMGSSFDRKWTDIVMNELDSESPEMRYEAIRATGQLEMAQALPRLVEFAYGDDYEMRLMAIWAMGEIATKDARNVLGQLYDELENEADDETLLMLEEAIETASLLGQGMLPMFDFEDDLDIWDDLDDSYLN